MSSSSSTSVATSIRMTQANKKVAVISLITKMSQRASSKKLGILKQTQKEICARVEYVKVPNTRTRTPMTDHETMIKILLHLPGLHLQISRLENARKFCSIFSIDPCSSMSATIDIPIEKSKSLLRETQPPNAAANANLKTRKKKNKRRPSPYVPMILRAKLWMEKYGEGTCKQICSQCNFTQLNPFNFHVGHIVSLKHGGSWDENNLLILCPGCNVSNGAGHQEHFKNLYFPEKMEQNTKIITEFVQSQQALIMT